MTNEGANLPVIVAILAMAAATYPMRIVGFWMMGRVPPTARIRRMLEASPGAVIVATVLPIAAREGVPAVAAILVGIGVMLLVRRDFVAVAAGMAAVAALRALGL